MENLKDLGSFLEFEALNEDFTNVEALKDELKGIQEEELGDAASVCTLHPDCTSGTLECFEKSLKNSRNKSKNVNEDGVFINIAPEPYEPKKGVAKDGWPYVKETNEKLTMENLKDLGSFLEFKALDEDFTNVEDLKDELKGIQEEELGDAASVCNLQPDCTTGNVNEDFTNVEDLKDELKGIQEEELGDAASVSNLQPDCTTGNVNEDGVFINIALGPYELKKEVAKDGWPFLKETNEKLSHFKEQKISQYKEKKSNISIVFLGHAGCGKSTTMSHMIYKLGGINEGMLKRAEEQTAAMNKYAWVLDNKLNPERECGDINIWKLETSKYNCTFIDTPGHRDFINNMITGISIADVAILVIDSTATTITNGLNVDTYDRASMAFAHGVEQVICCCNKMDATDPIYSEATYKEMMKAVRPQLKKIGFKKIYSLPISSFQGDNLVERSENMKWHMGFNLLEAIDKINVPKRPSHLPLR